MLIALLIAVALCGQVAAGSGEQSSNNLPAATVTLQGSFPLDEVLSALDKQTGNKLVDGRTQMEQGQSNPTIRVNFENMPYWKALDAVLDDADLALQRAPEIDELTFIEKPAGQRRRSRRAAYCGPLRLQANRVVAEVNPNSADSATVKLHVEIAWEPRLRPIIFRQPMDALEVLDDRGRRLTANREASKPDDEVYGGTAAQLELAFIAPPRSAKSIASCKGKLEALVTSRVETFSFEQLGELNKPGASSVEKKSASVTVALDRVRRNGELWEVKTRVRLDATAGDLPANLNWIFQNEAYLVGPGEKNISHSGFETVSQSAEEVAVAYLFELPAEIEQYSFVYKSPTRIHAIAADYELTDLPLP